MWRAIEDHFARKRSGVKLVKRIIELGIRVDSNSRLYLDDVEIGDVSLARAVGVDRRVVRKTVATILREPELRAIFTRIKPIGSSLVNVASRLGYSVLIVTANPHEPGILAGIASSLAQHGIVIRQALADDPDLVPEPKLTLVVEGKMPAEALAKLQALPYVHSITITK